MKISKLFHWLYAILMLLPFLVFIPNAFYYGFNEHAVAQEKTEQVPVYYDTNEISNINDLIIGNIYLWEDNFTQNYNGTSQPTIFINTELLKDQFITYQDYDINNAYFQLRDDGQVRLVISYNSNGNINITSLSIYNYTFSFIPVELRNNNLTETWLLPHITSSQYKFIKEYQPLTTSMSITDSMSYAWDSVWQNDLFSWSYGSFLTEPFIYIGNVFNVPNDNSLYYALSYWLDISIIWLCFDLVMYIPMLVHRWIDKGIIE